MTVAELILKHDHMLRSRRTKIIQKSPRRHYQHEMYYSRFLFYVSITDKKNTCISNHRCTKPEHLILTTAQPRYWCPLEVYIKLCFLKHSCPQTGRCTLNHYSAINDEKVTKFSISTDNCAEYTFHTIYCKE